MGRLIRKRTRELCIVGIVLIAFYLALQNPRRLLDFLGMVTGVLSPFLLGIVFAFLLERPFTFFADRVFVQLRGKKGAAGKAYRPLCVLATYLSVGLVITLAVSFIAPQIGDSVLQVAERVPVFLEDLKAWFGEGDVLLLLPEELRTSLEQWIWEMAEKLLAYLPQMFAAIPQITSILMRFGGGVFDLVIAVVASLYLLLSKDQLLRQLGRLSRAFLPEKTAAGLENAGRVLQRTFRSYVNGQLMDALVVGLVSAVGLSLLRFPYAVLVGTIMGLTNIIPFFGPFIGAVPGFLIIATADPVKALWYILFVVVVQQIDGNLIVPRIIGDSIGLPPFWVLVSVTAGGGLWGVWGMVLGMPLFAAFYKLLGDAVRQREQSKSRPTAELPERAP